MAPQRHSRSRRQAEEPQRSRSASPPPDDRPRRPLREWTPGQMATLLDSDSSIEPATDPFAPQTPDDITTAHRYHLRDPPYPGRGRLNQQTVSPTDRFIQRRRENVASRQERYSEQAEAASEGAGRRRLTRSREETRRSTRQTSVSADRRDLEEGEIQQSEHDDGNYSTPDALKAESSEDSDDKWSENQARGSDPTPGSDESDRPRPGFGARLPQDADHFFVHPDSAIPTIEEGLDTVTALQAQRDDFVRSERRLRSQLVNAEDRARDLEQTLGETEHRVRELEESLATQNEEVDGVQQEMRSVVNERDNLQDQVYQQNNDRAAQAQQLQEQSDLMWHQQQIIQEQTGQLQRQDVVIGLQERRSRDQEQRMQQRDRVIQNQDQQILNQRQQIAGLTARLNAPPQHQPPARRPRQRRQPPPPRRRLPRACKTRAQSYKEPRG